MARERGIRKVRVGRVISDRGDKTVIVAVERLVRHPLYGRVIKRTKKFMAHDEKNMASVGDLIKLMETRPLSKRKRWRLVEIVEKAR